MRLRSPSSRAPWPFPSPGEDDGSAGSPWISRSPAEALAVLWRDGPSSSRGDDGGAGAGDVGAGAAAGEGGGGGTRSFDDGGGGVTALRGGANVGDVRAREMVAGIGLRKPQGDGRRNAALPRGEVVVILREDARVPPGHVADAAGEGSPAAAEGAGRLCERAGLTLLRRVARVRVLSASESAAELPRFVCNDQRSETWRVALA